MRTIISLLAIVVLTLAPQHVSAKSAKYPDGFYEVVFPPMDGELPTEMPCARRNSWQGPHCAAGAPLMRFAGNIQHAESKYDENRGDYVVKVTLTSQGREAFALLTESHVGEHIAVVVDGEVVTAPRINEPIGIGEFELQGQQSLAQARELAMKLMAHRALERI